MLVIPGNTSHLFGSPSDFDIQVSGTLWPERQASQRITCKLRLQFSVLTVLSEVAKNCSTFRTLVFLFFLLLCLYFQQSVCLSVYCVCVCMYVMYCMYLSVCLSVCVWLFIHPFICLCMYDVYLSTCLSVLQYVSLQLYAIYFVLRVEVPTALTMMIPVAWYVTLFGLGGVYRRSRESSYLHNRSKCI